MKTAIFPGSFDPFTIGHADIVRRALPLFDSIIIAVGINYQKTPFFPLEKRLESIKQAFADEPRVSVVAYTELTVDFARENNAQFIIRGIRTIADFEYERTMADANAELAEQKIETIALFTRPELAHVSSSFVRDLASHGRDISPYLP
ncbi:MAG: pantetheine-phosphate adenylyltransferase [Paludibacteraceae bacterium]